MNKRVFPGVNRRALPRFNGTKLSLSMGVALLGAVTLAGCAHQETSGERAPAQSNVPSPLNDLGTDSTENGGASSAIDAHATDALDAMGTYLRTLHAFEVDADSATDAVLDNGQNAALLRHTVLKVKRPDRLRADITGDGNVRGIFYDGRRFTIYNQKKGFYARRDAPPTLDGLVHDLAANWHIETPLVDLFYWGNGKSDDLAITSAQTIGVEKVDTRSCTHYAYRQQGVDWELWIEAGRRPLPCKMIITDTTQTSRPRHEVTYHWRLNPVFAPSTFVFRPRAGARQIELQPADATSGQTSDVEAQ
ncbi:DUF2092 domain-containing protein [Paraburkholderia sp. Ac-20340]|uniref:DUF2092 domain-containing protein n=1 Tax=Paraburkholderia sp. Ac-20340 TaxID=2703888 RepID=UPI00197DE194|nr:DUF2092 domain-containing protein [Paraburkholderia sp. Ac-20340]